MSKTSKWLRIVGLVIHGLMAALLIFAGSGLAFGFAPPEAADGLKEAGLEEQARLIGAGELITAILLVAPRTTSLGVLVASAFWGGTILFHMSQHESYAFQSIMLVMTWVAAFLRLPAIFSSFTQPGWIGVKDTAPTTAIAA